jgi:recombinational DNA repair protein RecT
MLLAEKKTRVHPDPGGRHNLGATLDFILLTPLLPASATIPLVSSLLVCAKVRSPIPWVYGGFYIVYYKDIGEFQILYSQDICW